MKKTSILFALIAVATFTSSFVKAPKPKLFPDLEKFYNSLNSASSNSGHTAALDDIKSYILRGIGSDYKIDMAFTDADNSFTSAAAQIVLQSLLSVNKYNKLIVHSAGFKSGEISPLLIKVLSKHGYTVSDAPNAANGKKAYEVKFGENMPSLLIFSKQITEDALPAKNLLQVKNCSNDDGSCPDLQAAFFKVNLPFEAVSTSASEDEADKIFTSVAEEILAAFNKAKQ